MYLRIFYATHIFFLFHSLTLLLSKFDSQWLALLLVYTAIHYGGVVAEDKFGALLGRPDVGEEICIMTEVLQQLLRHHEENNEERMRAYDKTLKRIRKQLKQMEEQDNDGHESVN